MSLTPIETRYKGFRFRSRLEARWAVFFDTLRLRWEYEPEGFELPGGIRYLPDFRVFTPQGAPCWYEVKALHVERDKKFSAFQKALEADVDEWWKKWEMGLELFDTPVPRAPRSCLLRGDPYDFITACGDGCPVCPLCGSLREHNRWVPTRELDCFECDDCVYEDELRAEEEKQEEPGFLPFLRVYRSGGFVEAPRYQVNAMLREIRYAANTARGFRFDRREPVL